MQNVIPRHVKFNFLKYQKKYWYDNDPVKTYFANAVTTSIPYAERFFIVCAMSCLKDIKNKPLKKQVIHFIRQEANHSREHFRFFRQMVKPFYPKLQIKKKLFFRLSQMFGLVVGKKMRLAMVAAGEHLSTVAAELFLKNPVLTEGVEEPLIIIWRWHFVEEIEHKAIAFDMLEDIGCNYFIRILGFFFVSTILFSGYITPFLGMVCHDKHYKSKQFYRSAFQFFFGKSGLIRKLLLPYFSYLKPYFHPNQNDHQALLNLWINELSRLYALNHNIVNGQRGAEQHIQ